MESAILTAKNGIPVRLKGISPQINGANYEISPSYYNIKGELLNFYYKGILYTYIGEIDYYESDRKHKKLKKGYCKSSVYVNYKKYENQIDNLLKPENWFEDFEFAKKGDLFKIDRVEFKGSLTNGYKKYFIYSQYEFKINNLEIDFSNSDQYPPENLNVNSPNYSKKVRTDRDLQSNYSNIEEGNFFTKNFKNKIDGIKISDASKEILYEGIIKICFRIDKIYREVLDILAIEKLQSILNLINGIPVGVDAHNYIDNIASPITTSYLTKTDKTIAHLLIDWGYKDLLNTKELAFDVNEDQFYNGVYRPFDNYYNALVNFHNNLSYKDESLLFGSPATLPATWDSTILLEQDNKRFQYLCHVLPSSAISLLSASERIKVIETFINETSLSYEAQFNILKIIHSFYLFPEDGETFLIFLLKTRSGVYTNFDLLFRLFDDDTKQYISPVVGFFANEKTYRRNFIYGLYQVWKKSKYDFRFIPSGVTPTEDGTNPNAYFQTSQGEQYYKPDNDDNYYVTLEFAYNEVSNNPNFKINSDTEYTINKDLNREKVTITRVITHNRSSKEYIFLDPNASVQIEKKEMEFHLYQPLNMIGFKEFENLKEYLPKDPILPAFVYYYCQDYERIKEINTAWSTGIDIAAEILIFFTTGGVGLIKDLKYLKYVTKIGKAIRATSATQDVVLTLRGVEAGFEVFSVTSAMCYSAANYIATTSDNETAQKVARVFFWLTMLSAGATIYARRKAANAARDLVSNQTTFNTLSDEIKSVANHLVGAEDMAMFTYKAKLQNEYPYFYSYYIQLPNIGGVDYQKVFQAEFKNLKPNQLAKLNSSTINTAANWRDLYTKSIIDRKMVEVIANQGKVDDILRFYAEPILRKELEAMYFDSRWRFLDNFGNIDNIVYNELKEKPLGIHFLLDTKTLPKNSIEMFDADDVIEILASKLPSESHLGTLFQKNRLTWAKSIKNYPVNIEIIPLSKNQLKSLYERHFDLFANISKRTFNSYKGSNRLFVKINCYESGVLVEPTILENYLSGYKTTAEKLYSAAPNLKAQHHFVDPDDWGKFRTFARNAFDDAGDSRFNETEVKFLYNFFANHFHKGNRFVVEMESILYTCRNCQKYLQAAQKYAKSQNKIIEFKFLAHTEAVDMDAVLKLIE
ncbi:hypothetical protein EG344_17490 [Chryseobacterium sp. G0162]|uniref:hypothetical protein n=1 Tax=Chryseobacterium sp. G0162 TaxID=2487063 RepID=UPI000F50C424|nr:hypothetical protein [Chryseobacterium sp. G0162]AZB10495.1 hypothetical protein EG344_17490 [Chryseobacterium sp. G0162]